MPELRDIKQIIRLDASSPSSDCCVDVFLKESLILSSTDNVSSVAVELHAYRVLDNAEAEISEIKFGISLISSR